MVNLSAPTFEQPPERTLQTNGYIEWGPVLAGGLLAAALSFVFLTFLSAIGLSMTSPWPNAGMSAGTTGMVAVFFIIAQQIGSFVAGGYIAGRMRSPYGEVDASETDFRDGLHGGLVWALGVVVGAALAFSVAGASARAAATALGPAAGAVANQTTDVLVDALLRPADAQAAATGPAPQQAPSAQTSPPSSDVRAEVGRLITSSVASGTLTPANRTYLVQLVAQRTGISREEAERRVDEAANKAREAADKARKTSMVTALITGISLIISFAAAWWAAITGGNHRDNKIPARFNLGTFGRAPSGRN